MTERSHVTLGSPVAEVPTVGPARATLLHKLGIDTVRDMLFHLPHRYEDTRAVVSMRELSIGDAQTVKARIVSVTAWLSKERRLLVVQATLAADGATAEAVWFGKDWLPAKLNALKDSQAEVLVSGPVQRGRRGLRFRNPTYEEARDEQRHVGTLAPVYPETRRLTSAMLRTYVARVIHLAEGVVDRLPDEVRTAEGLMSIAETLRQLHVPDDQANATRAKERIAFEEHFLLQLAAERARRRRLSGQGVVIAYDVQVARAFVATLPFKLTDSQRVAAHEVLTDLASTGPMNRLLQGDVGSGKTVVAAMAALMAHRAGAQTAVMAPTEILAPHGLPPRLLVGSTSARARREVLEGLAAGHDGLAVGTHALIEDDVVLENLGLVVVDEQQRFGVAQRQRLRQKSGLMPNYLAMTATPIPRSLALSLYGDVDRSELREMPPGRRRIETRLVPPEQRAEAYEFTREEIRRGRQAFVICPLIEDSDKLGARSATAEYERLRKDVFPDLRVELLHGRMAALEKEERMGRFVRGEADLVVSTSVVEVGVDVPNATVMIIEGAERFGLAQLHQFRGRVGRAGHQSYCLLFQGGVDDEGSQRLRAVAGNHSGFELAELDLQLRKPGDVVGFRQHGLPEMQATDLLDVALARRARAAAVRWLDEDPELTRHAPLHEAMTGYRGVFDLD